MRIKPYDFKPIGERIKTARENKGYKQSDLAEKIDKGNQSISDLERGVTGLSVSTLMDICTFLEVDADYILFGKIANNDTNPINEIMKPLTHEQKLYIENMVKLYVNSLPNKNQ